MKSKLLSVIVLSIAMITSMAEAGAIKCETDRNIEIAMFSWMSAATLAHIQKTIIAEGYGCEVNFVPGDTIPTPISMMSKGKPHIVPEIWINSIQNTFDKGVAEGSIFAAGDSLVEGGIEGWYIPDYVAKKYPDLKSVEDLPRYKELFSNPENPSKGRFYSCPPGWICEFFNANLFKALGLENDYIIYPPGSSGALSAAIVRAYKLKEPILAYYWTPTGLLGKYNMVRLDMPPSTAEGFECNNRQDCKTPYREGYPRIRVVTLAVEELKKIAPDIVQFLGNMGLNNDTLNELLAWGENNKVDAEQLADHFLKTRQDLWTKWVPTTVAENVKASL